MSSKNPHIALLTAAAAATVAGIYYLYTLHTEKKSKGCILELPVIDYNTFLNRDKDAGSKEAYKQECRRVADALHEYGVCIVRDPRVEESDNNKFLDMMEKYFELTDWVRDARPEWHYQVKIKLLALYCCSQIPTSSTPYFYFLFLC
jgi:hypothetical protein